MISLIIDAQLARAKVDFKKQVHNTALSYAGKGTVIYKNSDKYEGEWAFGMRHGLGTLWIYKVGAASSICFMHHQAIQVLLKVVVVLFQVG
jgi:hypothetical protein